MDFQNLTIKEQKRIIMNENTINNNLRIINEEQPNKKILDWLNQNIYDKASEINDLKGKNIIRQICKIKEQPILNMQELNELNEKLNVINRNDCDIMEYIYTPIYD